MNTAEYKRLMSPEIIEILRNNNVKDYTAVVYVFEDIITGLLYVGTSVHFAQRLSDHIRDAMNVADGGKKYFYNVVRKYGWDRFNVYLLEAGLTQRAGLFREKKYIKWFDSYKNGYNMTEGGDGVCMQGVNNPAARKIKGVNLDRPELGEVHFDWIGSAAEELGVSINTISNILAETNSKQAFTFDRSERWTFKYEEDDTEWDWTISPQSIPIVLRNIDTHKLLYFKSINAAARSISAADTNVGATLRGIRNQVHSGDKTRRFEVQLDPIEREWRDNIPRWEDSCNIAVEAFLKDGTLFARYKSASEAGRALNITSGQIIGSARHRQCFEFAKGYRWEYADQDLRAQQPPRPLYKSAGGHNGIKIFCIQNGAKQEFSSFLAAARIFPSDIAKTDVRANQINRSVSSGKPCPQGIQWFKLS